MGQQLGFGGSLLPVLPPDDRPCTTLAPPTPNLLLRTSTLAYPSCCHQYSLLLPPLPLLLPTYSFLLLVCPSTPSYFHHPCSYPPPTPTPTSVHPYPSYTHSSSTPIILSLLLPTPSIVIRPSLPHPLVPLVNFPIITSPPVSKPCQLTRFPPLLKTKTLLVIRLINPPH